MDALLYRLGLVLVAILQALPLSLVVRLGRAAGRMVGWIDYRHRRVARENLTAAFGREKSPTQIDALVREQFKRLGENYAAAVKTASMTAQELGDRLEIVGAEKVHPPGTRPTGRIGAIGHFGNFELYAHVGHRFPELQFATTYRSFDHPALDRLLLRLRQQTGCLYFERRTESQALRAALLGQPLILGLLADQHAGAGGAWLPFFGRPCSTNTAPAVLALRYKLPLHLAICYRTGCGRWRIEISEEIPTRLHGQRRSVEDIMLQINRAFEEAVRRDPANWFWVHRRWKAQPAAPRSETNPAS